MSNPHTLSDFDVPIPLACYHCSRKLPKSSPVDIQGAYVIVHCPRCGCMTPFKCEATA